MAKVQTYNPRNGCYVLMEHGRVLDNKKQKFEGVPMCGNDCDDDEPAETQQSQPEPAAAPEPVEPPKEVEPEQNAENPYEWW